jgi:3-deoxy-D-manno-octulosonate 8-phosphate phosphatase (KDO 8-P phosphatase)
MSNFKEDLRLVKAFIFDVDGVLSSPKIYLYPDGELMRSMNIKDGFAIQYAIRKGYHIGIITGGNSDTVKSRFSHLGVQDIYLKSKDKRVDLSDFLKKYHLVPQNVLYMGDDLPDYLVMKEVGFAACPSDAVEEIKSISKYISDKKGGDGCVRDVIEQVLRLHGKWMDDDAFHW